MIRIWTLILSFTISGLTQDSSNTTLFLISGPEVLYAGTPTPLAVTVFANFSGTLTAEVGDGKTKLSQTEDFKGGITKILVLPPFSGSISPNSSLNLTVWGFRTNKIIFSNSTILPLNLRNVSFFIQTDRSRYNPGDTIKIRVVSVHLDNKPYSGGVEISLLDPSGSVVDKWNSTGNLGIVLKEFSLSQISPFGQWEIKTTVNEVTVKKAIIVEDHDDPPFKVLVKTSSHVLVGGEFSGSVRVLYPDGQPVRGTWIVTATLEPSVVGEASPFQLTQTGEIYGSARFNFSKDRLKAFYSSPAVSSNDRIFHILAQINDSVTGFTVNKTVEVHLVRNKFQLMFFSFPPSLKPSLHFSTHLKIRRYDGKPLDSLDLNNSAVVKVTQKSSLINTEPITLRLPVPEDGNIFIQFKLQDHVEMLFIQARFQSCEETLSIYNNSSSPKGSYIQITPASSSPAQIGLPLRLSVESTFQPATLHFVVSAKGQVLAAGTKNFSSSLDLTPALSWHPEACVTVYAIRSDGEIISDTARIPIRQHNHVTLNWSSEKAQPGEQVSLSVAANKSRFQVAITVMGMQNDALQSDMEFRVEQKCNLKLMTNTGLSEKKQPDGPKKEGEDLNDPIEQYWSNWADSTESLLWFDPTVSSNWSSEKITVPDGFTSLGAFVFVMSEDFGFGFSPVPKKLNILKDFSLSLDAPPHIIRGEEIVLEVNVINHLEQDIEIIVLIEQNENFEFVLMDRRGASVINAHRLALGSHTSAPALFPIRPLVLGEMEISVNAISADVSDKLVQRNLVKPEGVEQIISQTLFLELPSMKQSYSRSVFFSFPPDVVPGSQKAQVVLVGDILALSVKNMDSLVQIPTGSGEQNMIHFAPNVYVLQYLDKSTHDDAEIRSKALRYMKKGYEKQLSYQRDDGSFSAFGTSDSSGSVWLTAFVLRCFFQAQSYIQIDQTVLTRAVTWLLKHQGSQGEFTEVGKVIHTEMQGGLDDSPVALTAFVLLALLEEETISEMYEEKLSLALTYLENKVSSSVISNYSLCLVAYALALDNRPAAGSVLAELSRRAEYREDVMMWTFSADSGSHDPLPQSVQVEMVSYVLLAFFMRGSFIEGVSLMKWLSTQRNHLGAFRTTQDTVVGLQALASYAAFSGASAIDLTFNISSPASSFVSLFQINSTNYRAYQSIEINAEKDLPLNIYMQGRGFAIFQLNVFYNVESKHFSQSIQNMPDEDAFSLNFNLTGSNTSNMMLTVCTRLKDHQPFPQTGMVILDVGVLSGFTLLPGEAVHADFIRKVEKTPETISLYLDSVNKSEICIKLPFVRIYKVAHVQDAVLQIYDYYEPSRKATRVYNSDFLRNTDSCYSCGENCDRCRPGITVRITSPLLSLSTSVSYNSLSCLFFGLCFSLLSGI